MNFDKAIKFLNRKIKKEGTRSEAGQVLIAARDHIARRDASLLDFDWVAQFADDLYDTTVGFSGYGDCDWTDSIQERLMEILGIQYVDEDEEVEQL